MANKILVVRPYDTWITVALTNWCASVSDVPAELRVHKPGCPTVQITCAPGPCGTVLRTPTIVPTPSISLTSDGTVCGELRFQLTPAFKALGKGRFIANIAACGKTATFGLQVVDDLKVEAVHAGYSFATTPFVDGGEVVGELAVFNNCAVPRGWVVVKGDNGQVLGYARRTPSNGFCKPHRLTTCPTRMVYLK